MTFLLSEMCLFMYLLRLLFPMHFLFSISPASYELVNFPENQENYINFTGIRDFIIFKSG